MALAYFQETLDSWKYNLWKEDEKRGTLGQTIKGTGREEEPLKGSEYQSRAWNIYRKL